MEFKVTNSSNVMCVGDVFYSVPTAEEIKKAEDIIITICNENIDKYYSDNLQEKVYERLNYEIKQMCATDSVFHFLIVKEIAEVSRKEGFPIITLGDLSGSLISYLLGITEYDPIDISMESPVLELVWGTVSKPVKPDFSIGIAPQIHPLIQKHLDAQYGFVECDKELYKQISLIDVKNCEILGNLSKEVGKRPSIQDFDNEVYIQAAKSIIEEFLEANKKPVNLIEEIKQIERWDFSLLLRFYAYINGSFEQPITLDNLNNSNFFVTRDEFFKSLLTHNIPDYIALDIVKKGVWSQGKKRQTYLKMLKSYNMPEYIESYYSNVTHLWTLSSSIDRLLHKCYIAWYQENYPEIIDKLNN